MKKPLSLDDWCCLAVLLGFTMFVAVDHGAAPFFAGTAAGTVLLALAAVWKPKLRQHFFLLGFLLPVSLICVTAADHIVIHLAASRTIDAEMGKLEGGFSAGLYRWTLHHWYANLALGAVYYGLPLYSAAVLIVSPRRFDFARAWVLAALPAPLFYLAFPATGPAHIGDPFAPRNCIPSLHLTWALLAAVYVAPRWRPLAIVFAALTAVATLGTGEHYVADLIVALPYAWATCWVVSHTRQLWPRMQAKAATSTTA